MIVRKFGPWVLLALLVTGIVGGLAWPDGAPSRAERIRSLGQELKCPECQGLPVADSEAPTSKAIRRDIARRVDLGQSDAQIRQTYIDRYGESILLKPEGDGLGLVLWVLPVLALALGAAGIVFALRRNRGEPRLHATAADEELVARSRAGSAPIAETAEQ